MDRYLGGKHEILVLNCKSYASSLLSYVKLPGTSERLLVTFVLHASENCVLVNLLHQCYFVFSNLHGY